MFYVLKKIIAVSDLVIVEHCELLLYVSIHNGFGRDSV